MQTEPKFLYEPLIYIAEGEISRITTKDQLASYEAGLKRHEITAQSFTEGEAVRFLGAAPELLNACRLALGYLEELTGWPGMPEPIKTKELIQAAIAKAEGR